MEEAGKMMSGITFCSDAYDAMEGADAAVILTEWNEFRALDPARMASTLKKKILLDFRNIYKPSDMKAAGLIYSSIGRPE
jgi:UDPglucose 6-dehydrogenase